MTSDEFTSWRKASYSTGNSECVEVGVAPQTVGVRDTTQHGHGPVLEFPGAAWRAFIGTAKVERV